MLMLFLPLKEVKNRITTNSNQKPTFRKKGKINFEKRFKIQWQLEIANKFQFLNERKQQAFLLNFIPKLIFLNSKNIRKERYMVNSEIRISFKNIIKSKENNDYQL